MISYLQAIDVIRTFALNHYFINKFDFEFREQMPNLATIDEAFPLLFIVPIASDTLKNVKEFEVDVYCVDRYQKDRTNVNYVVSDCSQTLSDLVLWLEEGQDDIEITGSNPQTPINNDLLDYVGGWVQRLRLQVEKIGLCEIPFKGGQPTPPSCPSGFIRNSDGSFTEIVPSGDTLELSDIMVYVYDQNENLLGYLRSPSNIDVNITVEIPPCDDATIHNSDYSFTQSLASGSDTLLEDIRVNVLNSRDTHINSPFNVPSNSDVTVNFPDTEIVLKDTLGTTISTTNVPSGEANEILAPNGIVHIKKENDGTIANVSTPSGNTTEYIIQNNDITVNLANPFSIHAEDSLDIRLHKVNGNDITPSSVTYQGNQNRVTIVAPNSVITLKDSANATISTTNVQATESANITAPDGAITVNGSSVGSVKSNGSRDLFVKLNGANAGTYDGVNTINVTSSDAWVRPSGWLALDTVGAGTNNFSGLFAVYENQKNVCTIQIAFPSGTKVINWGDGTTTTASSATLYTKVYDYASLSSTILVDEFGYNYKMAVVNIPLITCTQLYIERNTTATLINNGRTLGWLDIAFDCSTLTTLFMSINQGRCGILQRLLTYNVGTVVDFQLAFCPNLKVLKFDFTKLSATASVSFANSFLETRDENNNPIAVTNTALNGGFNVFATSRITKLGNISLSALTSASSMFINQFNIKQIGNCNFPLVTTLANFQFSNFALEEIGVITTSGSLTSINNSFYDCRLIQDIEITNCSNVVTVGSAFLNCNSLTRLILTGMTRGFTVDDCNMSATSINALFTSLGTASGAQTINVRRNAGSATCNTSIATAKGFTVVIA